MIQNIHILIKINNRIKKNGRKDTSMARKTFISYKYNEARDLRDKIISSMGKDAEYYKGENIDSSDLTDERADKIKEVLKKMIYETSVLIVILSPKIKESKWMDWELEYSLKEIKRGNRASKSNGIVAVIMKYNNSYDWFVTKGKNCHGTSILKYDNSKLYSIISENHFNSIPPKYHCSECKTYEADLGSYISYIKEEDFLLDPNKYVEKAYEKSNKIDKFILKKQR